MKLRLAFAAALFLATVPLKVYAQSQPWLADRRFGEGIGIRAGNLEIHPGIAGEIGYDSNYFLRAPSEDPVGAIRFRVTPSISVGTLGSQRANVAGGAPIVSFRAGAFLAYNELIATDSAHSDEVSRQRNADAGADFKLELYPRSRAGIDTYASFLRVVQPSNDAATANAFNRDSVRAGVGVSWRPGGGLFSARGGYEVSYNYFELQPYRSNNNVVHSAMLGARWLFLPRTALMYDGRYSWLRYANTSAQGDGELASSRIGLNGLITNHFSLLANVGWASSFYRPGPGQVDGQQRQFDSVTTQIELKWFLTPQQELQPSSAAVGLSWVNVGYQRDFSNSYLGDFYQRDRGYGGVTYFVGGVVVLGLEGGFAYLTFPQSFSADGTTPSGAFHEQRVDARLFGEYRLTDTFGVNTTLGYDQNITSKVVPNGSAAGDRLEYTRWYGFVGARWFL